MTRGEKLYRLRIRSGLTLRQAARQIGISESTLWHYEQNDFFSPRPKVLQDICRLYHINVHMLEEDSEELCPLSPEELFAGYRRLSQRDKLRVLHILFD